ncbi:hypothetical protein CA13_14810 [Planctomycetes bacterium CA13]|uniref:Uncharacterized protein n=1 Tax=Novipirellula herctigrandis TaxID=2527986 RepID=A0A5C5YY93_9BACT|nr:hypothetical protein CA13_14810 [Planctomycetes bacterium CA13]
MSGNLRNPNESVQSRRDMLIIASALFAGGVAPIGLSHATEMSAQTLSVDHTRNLFRVRVEIDAKGNVNVPKNPLVSRKSDRTLPLTSSAVFDYEERFRRPNDAVANSVVTASERHFHEAESQSEVNRSPLAAKLRPEVPMAIVRRDTLPEITYSPDDYFTHEELDLLRMPVSSIAADSLLPSDPVVKGDQYVVEAESMRSLLNLSAVDQSDVKGEVVAMSPTEARLQLRGNIDGSVDGVPTTIRIVGKMTFDRTAGVTTWLAIAVHETREISKAEPGFDIATTIKMVRKPLDKPIAMNSQPTAIEIESPIPAERLYVQLRSGSIGFSSLMDRRWRMMSDKPGLVMMRMIDNDQSIAQCDFRQLSRLDENKPWTIEQFQREIRKTLGEQWREFVSATERESEMGLRVMSLHARGAVEEVPIEWVIQHYSDDSGQRVLATFTMEANAAKTFGGSDVQLSSTMNWIEVSPTAVPTSPGLATGNEDAVERVGRSEVQSASDRK